jgi:predicted nucleic acid-binding protein
MLTYLLDASAAVEIYNPRSERVGKIARYILEQKTTHNRATLLIPSFCIAEVFNALGKRYFAPSKQKDAITREEYETSLRKFRNHVHWGKTLYPYELSRYHIIGADQIIPTEQRLYKETEWDRLSTFDILIISMACEIAFAGDRENTYLLTCDKRLAAVSNDLKARGASDDVIEGPLGKLDKRRWVPPRCIYLPGAVRAEIPRVDRQQALNM